ncbi:MAG: hypothetical protein QM660_13085 [Dysgonomonas sp.]
MNNKINVTISRLIVWSMFFTVMIGVWCFSRGRELVKKESFRIEIDQ